MTGFQVVQTYIRSYPRLTALALIFNTIGSVIGAWQYGAGVVISSALAFALMTLGLKLMLLLMLHAKLFAFPRQVVPVALAIVLLAIIAVVASYPVLQAA